eukprot:c19720_g1_i3.p1 GENE.c19720_g1_i3~~c19720_g1_i3.p1  ORF type:complete len:692 (+),score=157.77 c19720_g1_i3:23-2077(+)
MVEERRVDSPVLSLVEFCELAEKCGLPTSKVALDEEVVIVLTYLKELAIVMWFNEPALSDLIILDPSWLIKAATKIICKFDIHYIPEHEEARKLYGPWKALLNQAILTEPMRDALWCEYTPNTRKGLTHLMSKYGLAVEMLDNCFLVPDLLKPVLAPAEKLDIISLECLFAFRLTDVMAPTLSPAVVTQTELTEGFLPTGIFVRLLAKSLAWSQSTSDGESFRPRLSKTQAVLAIGGDAFMMEEDQAANSIRVSFRSKNPLLVLERLQQMLGDVLRESCTNLEYRILLPTKDRNDTEVFAHLHTVVQTVLQKGSMWLGADQLSHVRLQSRFESWLPASGIRDWYDVFVSYRWIEPDSTFATKIFDCFRHLSFEGRRIEVFLDQKRLLEGRPLGEQLIAALLTSRVSVPIVSWQALERMALLTSQSPVDYVLMEWTVMVELHELGLPLLIQPIFLGQVSEHPGTNVQIGDFFTEFVTHKASSRPPQPAMAWLPEIVVESVVEQVGSFLRSHGLSPTENLAHRTVSATVNSICKHLGVRCDALLGECANQNHLDLTGLHRRCTERIFSTLLTSAAKARRKTIISSGSFLDQVAENLSESVEDFLRRNNLDRFAPQFAENGYETLRLLFEIADETLADFGMKSGHILAFRLALKKLLKEKPSESAFSSTIHAHRSRVSDESLEGEEK